MSELIEIHWTSGSIDEARRVCQYLVQERLVACAQIIPWIESIYLWDGKLDTSQESKVFLKSSKELFDRVRQVIEENCAYDVPEITATAISLCNPSYQEWLETTVSSTKI